MFFYLYKKSLKLLRKENATKEEIKDEWYVFKHSYRMNYIAQLLCNPILSTLFLLYLCGIGITLSIIGLITQLAFFSILVLPILLLILMSEIVMWKRNKWIKEGKQLRKFVEIVQDKLYNLYLINPFVISYKSWKKIKKVSKKNYDKIKSLESIGKCYETTFYIVNILKNKKIKMVWLLISLNGESCGHVVLEKGNWIYDTNRRRTYSKKKYLKHEHAKIFAEVDYTEYLIKNPKERELLIKEGLDSGAIYAFLEKYYENFKDFCESNGGIRATNDRTVTEENQE